VWTSFRRRGSEALTFSYQISTLSKSCCYHIRELRCFPPYLDFKTASTIATFIVHSKLDYCNSLYYNLPQSQIKEFQNIQISSACAVTRTPKSSHITPVLKFLHWLKINERIKYKLLSLTYKVLTTHQPQYLHDFIFVQPCHNTRSSAMVTLARPPIPAPLWKSQIALLGMLHLVYGMNSPLISASLVRHTLLHFLLSHMAVHHLHNLHYHCLHLLLLAQYFTLNSSANPFFHRPFPFLPDW